MTVSLHLGDCLEFMRTMAAGSVDAVVTDPPYGIGYKPGGNSSPNLRGKRNFKDRPVIGDNVPFDPIPFLGFPVAVLFGANNFSDKLPASRGWIVWDKRGDFEPLAFSDCELIWTNLDKPIRIFRHHWRGIIRASESGANHLHPTQKPLSLMVWVLENYTRPGDTIFDPFAGSGTTLVAAIQTGRNAIGCEIDEHYFDVAQRRIAAALAQPPLIPHEAAPQPEQAALLE